MPTRWISWSTTWTARPTGRPSATARPTMRPSRLPWTGGQLAHLSGLLDADGEVDTLERWALFRAGLSIGAALGRL